MQSSLAITRSRRCTRNLGVANVRRPPHLRTEPLVRVHGSGFVVGAAVVVVGATVVVIGATVVVVGACVVVVGATVVVVGACVVVVGTDVVVVGTTVVCASVVPRVVVVDALGTCKILGPADPRAACFMLSNNVSRE